MLRWFLHVRSTPPTMSQNVGTKAERSRFARVWMGWSCQSLQGDSLWPNTVFNLLSMMQFQSTFTVHEDICQSESLWLLNINSNQQTFPIWSLPPHLPQNNDVTNRGHLTKPEPPPPFRWTNRSEPTASLSRCRSRLSSTRVDGSETCHLFVLTRLVNKIQPLTWISHGSHLEDCMVMYMVYLPNWYHRKSFMELVHMLWTFWVVRFSAQFLIEQGHGKKHVNKHHRINKSRTCRFFVTHFFFWKTVL